MCLMSVETQQRQLEKPLGNGHSVLYLQKLLSDSAIRQKTDDKTKRKLLRYVVYRVKKIIEKVKLWGERK